MAAYAYKQGMKAFHRGLSISDNPYPFGSMLHSHWKTGWREAEAETDSEWQTESEVNS